MSTVDGGRYFPKYYSALFLISFLTATTEIAGH